MVPFIYPPHNMTLSNQTERKVIWMEKKPVLPLPIPPRPRPKPKPMPAPPMPMPMPMPAPPRHEYPCIPCDIRMLKEMYEHMKQCHKYEKRLLKHLMKQCKRMRRKHHHHWDSPDYWCSSSMDHRHHKYHYDCESSYKESSSCHHRHPHDGCGC